MWSSVSSSSPRPTSQGSDFDFKSSWVGWILQLSSFPGSRLAESHRAPRFPGLRGCCMDTGHSAESQRAFHDSLPSRNPSGLSRSDYPSWEVLALRLSINWTVKVPQVRNRWPFSSSGHSRLVRSTPEAKESSDDLRGLITDHGLEEDQMGVLRERTRNNVVVKVMTDCEGLRLSGSQSLTD